MFYMATHGLNYARNTEKMEVNLMDKPQKDTITVVTSGRGVVRGGVRSRLEVKVEELASNVKLFLEQMNKVLENSPEKVGKFQFVEIEVHAEVTAKGTLALLGIGSEAGIVGGLKFVFRRSPRGDM